MSDCIFCKIANGEVATLKVSENNLCIAFLDINPSSKGHVVVIPRKHYPKLEDVPEEEAKEMFSFICKLAKTVPKMVGTTDCNIGVNNGKFAGQEVPHLHFHIIPRFEVDNGIPFQGVVRIDVNREELPALAEKIITALQNPTKQKNNKEKSAEEKKPEEAKKETPQPSNEAPPKPKEEEKPTKSSEREWQEFVLKEQDVDIDISEIEK